MLIQGMSNAEVVLSPNKMGGGSTGQALPLESPITCFKHGLAIPIFLWGVPCHLLSPPWPQFYVPLPLKMCGGEGSENYFQHFHQF